MALSEQLKPLQGTTTEAEFIALTPDGYKHELVDGEVTTMPTSFIHDILAANFIAMLKRFAKGLGFVAASQAGFRMVSGNIRCPDASFTCKDRYPDGRPCEGFGDASPDICIEVISPSENQADMLRKIGEYFESGARQVWLVIPETERVILFTSPIDMRTLTGDDELTAGDILPDFKCVVKELFELD